MLTNIFILLGVATYTYASCFSSNGRIDKTESGQLVPVCEYNGLDLLDGSTFKTAGCRECRCSKGVLHCCGYGINAGTIEPPRGCKVVADGCTPVFVMETDATRDCEFGRPIQMGKPNPFPNAPAFPNVPPFPFPGAFDTTTKGTGSNTIDPFTALLLKQLMSGSKGSIDPFLLALADQMMGTNKGNSLIAGDMSAVNQNSNQPKQEGNALQDLLLLQRMSEM